MVGWSGGSVAVDYTARRKTMGSRWGGYSCWASHECVAGGKWRGHGWARGVSSVAKRIATRWMDNDVYGHVNNVVYYSYFDTAINQLPDRAWRVLDFACGRG